MGRGLVMFGGSGHTAVVIATARTAGFDVRAVFDDDLALRGTEVLSVPVIGAISEAKTVEGVRGVIAIGSNASRGAVARRLSFPMATVVHPAAATPSDLSIGQGTVVFAGATIQPRTVIGEHVIVNTGAIIDHDCIIGNLVHIGPGATICGGVEVEDGAFVAAGATIIPGVRLGAHSIVGAGAVVVADVPSGATVVGVPARVLGDQ